MAARFRKTCGGHVTPGGTWRLVMRELRANFGRSLMSALGIALGVGVLMLTLGLGFGAREVVLKEVVRTLPLDMIEVMPRTLDLGLIKVAAGKLLGGTQLDDQTIRRLSQIPEVSHIYPRLEVKIPMGAQGGARLFGRRLYTDLFMTALPKELIQKEAGDAFLDNTDFVPVVISDQLIEVYNSSVASSLGAPHLTIETLKGFEFDILFGRSMMLGDRGAKQTGTERGRIVGVSRHAMRLGVTVPLETGQRLLAKYGDTEAPSYGSLLIRAKSANDVPKLIEAIRGAGLTVDENARRTGDILTAATSLTAIFGILVLLLAALNITHSFYSSLNERRRELGVLRALGAQRIDLLSLVLWQAAMLGVVGAALGIAGSGLCMWVIDAGAQHFLPQFPFKPDSFFYVRAEMYIFCGACGLLAACLGACAPALKVARRSISEILADL